MSSSVLLDVVFYKLVFTFQIKLNYNRIKHNFYCFSSEMYVQTLDPDTVLVTDPITDYLNIKIGEYEAVISSVLVVVQLV